MLYEGVPIYVYDKRIKHKRIIRLFLPDSRRGTKKKKAEDIVILFHAIKRVNRIRRTTD